MLWHSCILNLYVVILEIPIRDGKYLIQPFASSCSTSEFSFLLSSEMSHSKNYYGILNITKIATSDEVKKALVDDFGSCFILIWKWIWNNFLGCKFRDPSLSLAIIVFCICNIQISYIANKGSACVIIKYSSNHFNQLFRKLFYYFKMIERYRRRARETHPDKMGTDKEEEFKLVSEAYQVLSDRKSWTHGALEIS